MTPTIKNNLLLLLMLFLALPIHAYDFISNGIAYTVTSFTELKCAVSNSDTAYEGIIEIPNTVEFNGKELIVNEISAGCFKGCEKLTNVVLNDHMEIIGDFAFSECVSIKQIDIPNTVKEIGRDVFYGCSDLTAINLPESFLYVPEGFIRNCPLIDSFRIPETTQTIRKNAFNGCSNLSHIIIPSSVLTIEESSFDSCGLQEIAFCDSDEDLNLGCGYGHQEGMGWKSHWVYYGLFTRCPLKKVVLGRNLTYNCKLDFRTEGYGNQQKKLDILYPPFWLDKLESLTITSTVDVIPENLFYGCSLSDSLIINNSNRNLKIRPITYYPEDSGNQAYNNFNKFAPETLFLGRDIDAHDYSKFYPWNVTSDNLSSLTFSDFVTDIEGIRLKGEKNNLTYIYIGNNVNTIVSGQFEEIPNLNDLYIGQSVKKIENTAFINCISLQNIILPQSLEYIGMEAFGNCPITNLTLPYYLKSISTAFQDCPLESIIIESPNPPISSEFSNSIYLNCALKVPYGFLSLYKDSEPWANFWNIEEAPEIFAQEIIISDNIISIEVNEEKQLFATISPYNTSNKSILWSSTNPEIAEVSENGMVKGISNGECAITATCGNISSKCEIIVTGDSGVKDLTSEDNIAVKVYTLNGTQVKSPVENLQSGLYIVVKGNERKKIYVK